MFITEEELNRRLSSQKNLAAVIPSSLPDRSQEKPAPKELKTLAASLVAQGVSSVEVSKQLNISQADIKAAPKSEVNKSIERIRDLAIDRLLISLGLLTQDKFENAPLREIANTAAHLSKIIERTGDHENVKEQKVIFVMHQPVQKTISNYQVLDV